MNAEQYVAYQSAAGNSQLMEPWDGVTDTDWFDALYGDGGSFQRHTAGFEPANDNGSVYASLSYMNNDGMYYGDKDWLKRITFQLNGDYKIKEWLTFDQQYGRELAVAEPRRRHQQGFQQFALSLRPAAQALLRQGQPADLHAGAHCHAGR